MHITRFRNRTLAVAAVGALTITGTALAAHPHASKKYGGHTSAAPYNGYHSQVTFKVSKDAKRLLNFTYQSDGCYPSAGTLQPGVNYLKQPANVQNLGTIAVSSSGRFSKKNVITTYTSGAQTTTTKSTVSGRFKNAKTAVGTITFTQFYVLKGTPTPVVPPCGPVKVTFTATQAKSAFSGIGGGY